MKNILFHLPNEGLESLESFELVFLCTYKHDLLVLHIWSIQVVSCDPCHRSDAVKVR